MSRLPLISASLRANSEWPQAPRPIPHTVFDQPCIDFVNSEFTDHVGSGRRYDRLILVAWRRWFLQRYGLEGGGAASDSTVAALMMLRLRLRALLEAGTDLKKADLLRFNRILAASPLAWQVSLVGDAAPHAQLRLVPTERSWKGAMGLIVHSYLALVTSGDVTRVKQCSNEPCSFLFFDSTRNRTRRWCDLYACGNLTKVRRYRSRRG